MRYPTRTTTAMQCSVDVIRRRNWVSVINIEHIILCGGVTANIEREREVKHLSVPTRVVCGVLHVNDVAVLQISSGTVSFIPGSAFSW